MPTYTYKCKTCGNVIEELQSINEDPLKTCPHCHEDALKRVIYPAPVIFIGVWNTPMNRPLGT